MKARRILSGLLVMLLLCGSSWAAACALSCTLHRTKPMCHEVAGQRTTRSVVMAAGQCAGMAESTGHGLQVDAVSPAEGCGHRVLPAERIAENSPDEAGQASVQMMYPVPGTPVVALRATAAGLMSVSRDDPDGYRPLATSLRV